MDVPLAHKLEGSLLKTYKQDDYPNKIFLAYRGTFPQPHGVQERFVCGLSAELSPGGPNQASGAPSVVFLTVCMTNEGHPWVSLVVQKTRLQISQDPSLNYEYLPTMGLKSFIQASLALLFGKHSQAIVENRVGGVHTVGDSGAFQLGIQFLRAWHKDARIVYIISSQK
ncbi:GOT1L1 isoform 2, partial [Pan troglodytes]